MQDYLKPSLDYIEQNLKTDINNKELANMTGYSVVHYCRMFKQITGLPVAGVVPYIQFDMPEEDDLHNVNSIPNGSGDYESQFDLIADNVRKSLNMELIYKILNGGVGE